MKIGFHSIYDAFNVNDSFLDVNSYVIGENLEYPFVVLNDLFQKAGSSFHTLDKYRDFKIDKVIFTDFPNKEIKLIRQLINHNVELYLVLFESSLIKPYNWKKENHKYFKKVFTWNDDWVDGKKYIKYYWPNKIPDSFKVNNFNNKKLSTMIAGNKMVYHDNKELYSERIKTIRWFEQYQPEKFDLFGLGWETGTLKHPYTFVNKISITNKVYNRIKKNDHLNKLLSPLSDYFPSYKGKVLSKREIYSNYKFAFCYENAKDIPGYITEKIFDCFFAGCVPIYWGAPNVTDYIPPGTFIDRRKFKTMSDLFKFIDRMPDSIYMNYLEEISKFLYSKEIHLFSAKYFSEIIFTNILTT